MNHNDINRQCAEAMGWKKGATIAEVTYWFPTTSSRGICLPDFCNDWNAMKLLKEYANERDFALYLSEEEKDICCAEFISRKTQDGYVCEYADTFTEAAALAFRKCFGKEKVDGRK